MRFVDGFIRPGRYANSTLFTEDGKAKVMATPSAVWGLPNLGGAIALAFNTTPSVATGSHYPIGKIYLDFSQLLDDYNAHTDSATNRVVGAVDGFTKYYFVGDNLVEDTLGLSFSETDEPKLWEYDFSKDSDHAYRVDVLYAGGLDARIVPGKGSVQDESRVTEFYAHEKDTLHGVLRLTAPTTRKVYDLTSYLYIPHSDHEIRYMDDDGKLQTAKSDYDMYLRGIPSVVHQSDAFAGTVSYSYTTDLDPSAASNWQTLDAAAANGWSDADWRAVRGLRVHVDEMDVSTRLDIRVDLGCDAKKTIEVLSAYGSGSYDFAYSAAAGAPHDTVVLGEIEFRYINYTVTDPASSHIWYDTYDEDGVEGGPDEGPVQGVTVQLYDTDGTTLIDSAMSDANGGFGLESWKQDAGQILKIILPTTPQPKNDPAAETAVWKLTRQSTKEIIEENTDSDFNRETNSLELPRFAEDGVANVSAGLVRLPELTSTDIVMNIGKTKDLSAVLNDYIGELKTDDEYYNVIFHRAVDPEIADVTGDEATLEKPITGSEHTNTVSVPVKGLREGTTTVTIQTQNKLGDVVETTANITVNMTYTDITVSKVWDDNEDAMGIRPGSITVELHRTMHDFDAEGEARPTLTLNGSGSGTFKDLPEYCEHGEKYVYSVEEVESNELLNYKAVYSGSDNQLTVTNTLKTIEFNGVKLWEENGSDFVRPDSLTINLYRSDDPNTVLDSLVIAKDESKTEQEFSFTGLLQYAPDGSEYKYTVKEASVPNGYLEVVDEEYITNIYNIHIFDFLKEWDFTGAPEPDRPDEVTIDVFRDGELYKSYTLKASEGWKKHVEEASTDINGHEFTIEEHKVDGYIAHAEKPVLEDSRDAILFRFMNTYDMPKVTVSGTKTWIDVPDGVEEPIVTVTLYRSTAAVAEEKVGEQTIYRGASGYHFEDLDRYDSAGNEYQYRLEEAELAQYTVSIEEPVVDTDTGNVTIDLNNTYNPEPINVSIPVSKDVHEEDALPASFGFTLQSAEGSQSDTITIETEGDGTFNGEFNAEFLTFDRPGTWEFTVSEDQDEVEGFTYDLNTFSVTVTVRDDGEKLDADIRYVQHDPDGQDEPAMDVHFYNTYQRPVFTIYGEKIWENVPEEYILPDITINLYRDGETEPVDTLTLVSGEDEFAFEEVYKYDLDGNPYSYRVEEEVPHLFEVSYAAVTTDENGDLAANITNTYVPPLPVESDPPVMKTVSGLDGETDAEFTFVLTPVHHTNPMPEGHEGGSKKATVIGAGAIEFGTIEFTEEGVYDYTVTEVAGEDESWAYDTAEYTIRYTVTESGGSLHALRTFLDQDGVEIPGMTAVIFENTYQGDDEPEPEPPVPPLYRLEVLPKTGFSALRPEGIGEKPLSLNYGHSGWTLQIPSLSLITPLVTVPYAEGEYPVAWLDESVGMLEGYDAPGSGPVIMTGHNHLNNTEIGPFALLKDLNEGDRIYLLDERGQLSVYAIYANEKISEDDIAGLVRISGQDAHSITLITCEDERVEGGYANRRIIAAREIRNQK